MIKYISKLFFTLLFITGILWFIDNSGSIVFTSGASVYVFSYITAFILLFGIFLFIEIIIRGFSYIINMLKHDVLVSNHSFKGDSESIEVIKAGNKDKIVLSRSQFDEAAILIVKTMSAITAGIMNEARRNLVELRKIIGKDAIIDVLMLKIYKGEKNFDKMEQLSQKLMNNEDIQLVGMKAALEAQMEKKEFTEALKTVNQAFEVRQDLYWVIGSAFLLRAKNNDWLGALEVLEAGIDKNITPEHKASRLKAVALYELAQQAKADKDSTNFFKFITQALNENQKLIPAAIDLANYYIKTDNQIRKAERVLSNIWSENPSYDVAEAYLNLFSKDSIAEKIQRMEKLALMNSKRPSLNNIILAELYIKAKKYAKAKTECQIFLLKNPATRKMVDILDTLETKNRKKHTEKPKSIVSSLKEKLSNMTKDDEQNEYPKDFQWVCANCGHISDKWHSICDECGEIGRNYWHLYVDEKGSNTEEE
jgi:uncharacterized membrane-anchored protein